MRLEHFEFAISFSEDSNNLAKMISDSMGSEYTIYYYKNWIFDQVGQELPVLTQAIYSSLPVLFLITEGWLNSQICQKERSFALDGIHTNLALNLTGNAKFDFDHNMKISKAKDTYALIDDVVCWRKS